MTSSICAHGLQHWPHTDLHSLHCKRQVVIIPLTGSSSFCICGLQTFLGMVFTFHKM
jgi:hypothetical protein